MKYNSNSTHKCGHLIPLHKDTFRQQKDEINGAGLGSIAEKRKPIARVLVSLHISRNDRKEGRLPSNNRPYTIAFEFVSILIWKINRIQQIR